MHRKNITPRLHSHLHHSLCPMLIALVATTGILTGRAEAQKAVAPASSPASALPSSFRIVPGSVNLTGAYSQTRVLVDAVAPNVATEPQDISAQAGMRVLDTTIASIDELGIVRPRKDGNTILVVKWHGVEKRIPVHVTGMAHHAPPQFVNDVVPVLSRAGCNMGGCHGAASGKGGFKLSLLGYDPESDYVAISRGMYGRRVAIAQPDQSLLLKKPLLAVPHRGGKKLEFGSADYNLLRDWIGAGLPGPLAGAPTVKKLEVTPPVRTLGVGKTQRFAVAAVYSDGTRRDVTPQTIFTASDETVASVTPTGEAKVNGNGEGAILVRYQDLVATARVISPFGPPRHTAGAKPAGKGESALPAVSTDTADAARKIDTMVAQKLDSLGLQSSPICSDTDFLRRVSLDVAGRLPTADEVRAFVADKDTHKRDQAIDRLLDSQEYIDFWTLKWGDILRCSRQKLTVKGMYSYHDWIRASVAENKPWDKWAKELVLAQGSIYMNGAANFFRTAAGPNELAETTSEIFLGVRIACARCHNHPYEKWTQNQYYQMTAFFARTGSKAGDRTGELVIYNTNQGEVTHPKTQKTVAPCALDAQAVPDAVGLDRRQALADWLTAPQNPFFSHVAVNRVWRHYLGVGFVEPVDDLRITNPPSNATLYDWLSRDLSSHGYDLKYLMRSILRSQTYQRSPEPLPTNARDSRFYSHFSFKRIGAEPLLDAISYATGVSDKFAGLPMGTRACELPDTTVSSYFLDLFGRPARNVTCECERSDAPNLGQILHLMNDSGITGRIADKTGRIATLLATKPTDAKIVEELYLNILSRFPSPSEKTKAIALLTSAKPDKHNSTVEDIAWALLNSKEFVFNH